MGKSLTAAAYISMAKKERNQPTLIVVPYAIMAEWKNECYDKFFKRRTQNILFFHSNHMSSERYKLMTNQVMQSYDVVVTTYDILKHAFDTQRETKGIGQRNPGGYELSYLEGSVYRNIVFPLIENGQIKGIDYVRERTEDDVNDKLAKGSLSLYYVKWHRVVCDEIQRMTNQDTLTFLALMGLFSRYKWGLSGTPIRNKVGDYFSEIRFLGFNAVKHHRSWSQGVIKYMNEYRLLSAIYNISYEDYNIILPTKYVHNYSINLTKKERYYILMWLGHITQQILKVGTDSILTKFTRLRQACICAALTKLRTDDSIAVQMRKSHYYQNNKSPESRSRSRSSESTESFDSEEKMQPPPPEDFEIKLSGPMLKWINDIESSAGYNSTKIRYTVSIVKEKVPEDDSVIIFTVFSSCLAYIKKMLEREGFTAEIVDGNVKNNDRKRIFSNFRNKKFKCLLLNYAVGAEGLNLTVANHCIFVDQWWNNAIHLQAEARVYRRGQEKETHMYYLRARNSIDIGMQILTMYKTDLASNLLGGTLTKELLNNKPGIIYDTYSFIIQKTKENIEEVTEEEAINEKDDGEVDLENAEESVYTGEQEPAPPSSKEGVPPSVIEGLQHLPDDFDFDPSYYVNFN
jgi:SNF2 family DNA or RNA helicase